jgi:hypothetical protein
MSDETPVAPARPEAPPPGSLSDEPDSTTKLLAALGYLFWSRRDHRAAHRPLQEPVLLQGHAVQAIGWGHHPGFAWLWIPVIGWIIACIHRAVRLRGHRDPQGRSRVRLRDPGRLQRHQELHRGLGMRDQSVALDDDLHDAPSGPGTIRVRPSSSTSTRPSPYSSAYSRGRVGSGDEQRGREDVGVQAGDVADHGERAQPAAGMPVAGSRMWW